MCATAHPQDARLFAGTLGSRSSLAACLAALLILEGAVAAQCPIVERGSPTDGLTTISVLETEAPCDDGPLWAGWNCMRLQSDANSNGAVYVIDVRWNRVGTPVLGSFTWLLGNDSTGSIRELALFGQTVQDLLDVVDRVRTIELRFLGSGTFTPPRNGFANISAVYADVVEFLVSRGIAVGVLGHFGNSGGSMMCANALAYHDLDLVLDGAVFGGGPFWSDLEMVCTDPSSPVFADDFLREVVDDLNWRDVNGGTFCLDMASRSSPSYGCLSTLGVEADAAYPNTIVSVIVGSQDDPWVDASAANYLMGVVAARETFDRPLAPHLVLDAPEGADAVYRRIVQIVAAAPSLRLARSAPDPAPGVTVR